MGRSATGMRACAPSQTRRGIDVHYRIYLLDQDGRIRRGHDAHCSTDAEAFAEIAHTVGIFSAAELWRGTRRVGRWEPRTMGVAASDWDGRHSLESTTFRTGRLLTPSAPGQLGPTRQTAAPVMAHAGEDLTERPAAPHSVRLIDDLQLAAAGAGDPKEPAWERAEGLVQCRGAGR